MLNGYPGSVPAPGNAWGGRATQSPALGVLIATSSPLDQYRCAPPGFFLGASPEHARIDPDQLLILLDHVRCAAFELPFLDDERFGNDNLEEILAYLGGASTAPRRPAVALDGG